jgi:hypothetical protein
MATQTRVNGFSNYTTGALRSVAQLKAFIITIKDTSSAIDLQTLDDGADEMIESVIREVQPLMYYAPSASSGVIHVIVDGHGVDAASLLIRIKQVVIGQGSYGTLSTNVSTCTEGTTFVVA